MRILRGLFRFGYRLTDRIGMGGMRLSLWFRDRLETDWYEEWIGRDADQLWDGDLWDQPVRVRRTGDDR